MNKSDLIKLVEIRVKEAKILFDHECYHGSYYLLGYALECALKVCITNQVKAYDFPNKTLANQSHQHDLEQLLIPSGLKFKLAQAEKDDEDFKSYWLVVKDWSEITRYEISMEEKKAKDFLDAVTNEQTGVLQWIKRYW